MVAEMEHEQLDFVEILPIELVEEIFQYLTSSDLVNCSLVSVSWREIVNNNCLWLKLCMQEKIHNKEHLQCSQTHFRNPIKVFRPVENKSERLSDICYWRTHYDRYKCLRNNWKSGRCCLHRLNLSNHTYPAVFNDGTLVIAYGDKFDVYTIAGDMKKLFSLKFHFQNVAIDKFLVNKDMLIYSQSNFIFGVKLDENYQEAFALNADLDIPTTELNDQIVENDLIIDSKIDNKRRLFIRRCDNLLIVVDYRRNFQFIIWNIHGTLERVVQFEEGKNGQLCQFDYCEVFNMRVYVAYTIGNCHYVREYDLVENQWCGKVSVPNRVKKLYLTEEILGAKLIEMIDTSDFFIWSLKDMSEVSIFSVNGDKPIAVIDNVVIHCNDSKIQVQSTETPFLAEFKCNSDVIVNMFAINHNLLVLNTGDSIEVWDWRKGEKLYTPYRGICSSSMWVDEKMIIISRWSCNFQVIGYW